MLKILSPNFCHEVCAILCFTSSESTDSFSSPHLCSSQNDFNVSHSYLSREVTVEAQLSGDRPVCVVLHGVHVWILHRAAEVVKF